MRHRRCLLLALTVCLMAGVGVLGQGLVNPFDVGLGVRAMGFGGAYLALAEGTEALLINPAGLGWTRGLHADSSLSRVLGLYTTTWLSAAAPNLAAGMAFLGVGGITDPQGNPLPFSHFGLVVGAGVDLTQLRAFPFAAAGGISLKYNRVRIADQSGGGVALDIGLLGQIGVPLGTLRFGLALREFGFGPRVGETAEGWSTDLAAGVALVTPGGLLAALDVTSEYTALGVGWSAFGAFELRTGIRLQGGLRWALGLGARWGMFVLDYALLTHPMLSSSHRFGFGARF